MGWKGMPNPQKLPLLLSAHGPHLQHPCHDWPHSPPPTTARLLHIFPHNYATKSPLITIRYPKFTFKTAPSPSMITTHRSQWSSGKMLDCSVFGPRIEAHHGLVFITTTTAIYSLGHGLCTLTAVPQSTEPSIFRAAVKWVPMNARLKSGELSLPDGR